MSIEDPIVVLKDSIYYVTTKFVLNNYEMIPFLLRKRWACIKLE